MGEPNDFHKSREKFPVFHEKTGEKVLTEAAFGCYDTQVSDRKEEADPYGERPPRPLHDDGGDAHGFHAYDAPRSKHGLVRSPLRLLIGNESNQDLRNERVSQVFFHGIGPERLDPADQCVYVYKGKGRPHDRIKAFGQDL